MATKKPLQTAQKDQTAPTLTNAIIYRAGQNPAKQPNESEDDDQDEEMITTSYYLPEKLNSDQQPTFVDALKRRRDHQGRVITKSRLLNKPSQHTKSASPTISTPHPQRRSSPIPASSSSSSMAADDTHVQFNNLSNYPCTEQRHADHTQNVHKSETVEQGEHLNAVETEQPTHNHDAGEEEEEDDSSDSDFDMDNLTVPKVENETASDTKAVHNEADDIREKFKQRMQLQKQEELQSAPMIIDESKAVHATKTEQEEDSAESSSEYETESSSEEDEEDDRRNPRRRRIRFLNKKQREEHEEECVEQNKLMSFDEGQQMLNEMEEDRKIKMAQQTKEDVLNYIREQEKQERDGTGDQSDEEMPDDADDDFEGEEGQKEFELWKLREIKRNLRDEEARQQREQERVELEKRRKMTDEEIMRENERLGLHKDKKKKGNMKFMQKYYHQGVFYRDGSIVEDQVLDRNFNAPTGQDKYIDFEKVPEAMRRKNFGKMSQSKWTHLANEDTTYDKEEREWFKKKAMMSEEEKREIGKNKLYQFRHKAHENNFWFSRGGSGTFDRPSYKQRNMNSANQRFERREDRYDRHGKHDKHRRHRHRDRDRDRSGSRSPSSRRRR